MKETNPTPIPFGSNEGERCPVKVSDIGRHQVKTVLDYKGSGD
ncbi:MAG: hypothetical protein V5A83_01645 [Candidatus Bipolaricaulota bacterium]